MLTIKDIPRMYYVIRVQKKTASGNLCVSHVCLKCVVAQCKALDKRLTLKKILSDAFSEEQ